MRESGNGNQEMGIGGGLRAATTCQFLFSSSWQLCVSWVQHVYRQLVRGVYMLGLCAGSTGRNANPEYKYYALGTAKPPVTPLVVPSHFGQFTAVSQPVIPIIHTANKNNNKVNYLKSYLLLIPVRSPV